MAGVLPEMKFMSVTPALTAYRAGVDDYRADQKYAQEQDKLNLLKRVGQTAATQGLGAAATQAMSGGEIGTGIQLQNLSIDRQAKLFDFMSRGAMAADTPEKWQAYIGTLAKTFGPDSVKGFEDFRTRESAIMLSMTAKEQAEQAFRKQQLALQERGVAVQEAGLRGRPETKTVKDAQGAETLVRVNPDGRAEKIYGDTSEPTNPYSSGKMNEGQGKAATYADRMAGAHKIITDLEDINKGAGGFIGGSVASTTLPGIGKVGDTATFNLAASADRQRFMQAKRDFVNAVLRRESGAVISESEFANADKQYFPQPGDSAAVIEQKRQNRITALQGIMREAGPGYKAPAISTAPKKTSDAKNPALPKGVTAESALAQARAAIEAGRDRTAVINRLKSWGVDTSGL